MTVLICQPYNGLPKILYLGLGVVGVEIRNEKRERLNRKGRERKTDASLKTFQA